MRVAEVLHVGDRDDRRLGLPVEVAAPRQQRVVDHVDHDPVLDLVLGAGDEVGGDLGVGVGVAGARRGAGERVRAHGVPVDARRAAPATRRRSRRWSSGSSSRTRPCRRSSTAWRSIGCSAVTRDLAGDHRLDDPPGAHRVACRGDGGEVPLDGRDRLDRVGVGRRRRRRRRRQCLDGVVDAGDPATSRRRPCRRRPRARRPRRRRPGRTAPSRGRPGRHRSEHRRAGLVDVVDRAEHRRHVVDGDPGGDAAAGEPDAVADEQEPVAAGDVVEVEGAGGVVGAPSDGPHQAGPGGAPGAGEQLGDAAAEHAVGRRRRTRRARSCATISSGGGR